MVRVFAACFCLVAATAAVPTTSGAASKLHQFGTAHTARPRADCVGAKRALQSFRRNKQVQADLGQSQQIVRLCRCMIEANAESAQGVTQRRSGTAPCACHDRTFSNGGCGLSPCHPTPVG